MIIKRIEDYPPDYRPFLFNEDIFGNDQRKINSIKDLYHRIVICNKCPGFNSMEIPGEHTLCVRPRGSVDAEIFIVGQSNAFPQAQYNKKYHNCPNVPFLLGCGELLNKCLKQIGKDRTQVWITNVVKAHPPGNRPSQPSEIANCLPYLIEEIKIIKPKIIITLGRDAYEAVSLISRIRKIYRDAILTPIQSPLGFTLLAMYHPAYINRSELDVNEYIKSFDIVNKILDNINKNGLNRYI